MTDTSLKIRSLSLTYAPFALDPNAACSCGWVSEEPAPPCISEPAAVQHLLDAHGPQALQTLDFATGNPRNKWKFPAQQLSAKHLGRLVLFTSTRNEHIAGRLDKIELHRDPRTAVGLRVATGQPTDSGGWYWSTWGDCAVWQATDVSVGFAAPEDAAHRAQEEARRG